MAFVNEEVSEKDRDKLRLEKCWAINTGLYTRIPRDEVEILDAKAMEELEKKNAKFSHFHASSRWAADRERDAYVFRLGGGGGYETPTYYALNLKGEIVLFNVWELAAGTTGNYDVGMSLVVKVEGVRIPHSLSKRRDEIKRLIREGLEAYGIFGKLEHVISVTVEFDLGLQREELTDKEWESFDRSAIDIPPNKTKPAYWVVDRLRNIFLLDTTEDDHRSGDPYTFILCYKNRAISVRHHGYSQPDPFRWTMWQDATRWDVSEVNRLLHTSFFWYYDSDYPEPIKFEVSDPFYELNIPRLAKEFNEEVRLLWLGATLGNHGKEMVIDIIVRKYSKKDFKAINEYDKNNAVLDATVRGFLVSALRAKYRQTTVVRLVGSTKEPDAP